MDQLKKIFRFYFWMLLVVALAVPVVGWSMARSGMMKETEERTVQLKKTQDQLKAGPDDPNADWQKGVTDVNNVQKSQVRDAWMALYENQLAQMTWPKDIPDDPTKLQAHHLQFYLKRYPPEIERVRQIVKPLDEFGENGLIDLADGLMPHPEDDWQNEGRPPTAKEVEAAQEDVWLLTALLKAIASVNSTAKSQYDAPIRQVVTLTLRGGSENAAGSAPAAQGLSGLDAEEQMMNERLSRANRTRASGGPASVSFNPDEEFGTEVPDPEAAAAAAASSPPGGGQLGRGDDDVPVANAMANRFGRGAMMRYVQDKPEWKTRGFYIELVMDHRMVPDLLVALANADWPIRVTRVHQADLKDEELISEENPAAPRAGGPMAGGARPRPGAGGIGGRRGLMGANPDDIDQHERGQVGLLGVGGARGGMARGNRPAGGASASAALDDHMLANVALDGLITIFKKPPEEEAVPAASQELPTDQPATEEQPSAETGEMPAETAAATEPADAAEPTEEPTPTDAPADSDAAENPSADGATAGEKPAVPDEKPTDPPGDGS